MSDKLFVFHGSPLSDRRPTLGRRHASTRPPAVKFPGRHSAGNRPLPEKSFSTTGAPPATLGLTEPNAIRLSQQELSRQFWAYWLQYREYLVRLALRWTSSNMADAEDAVSRVGLKAHDRYLRDAPRIRNMRAWLSRLLHNVCMDEHRKHAVRGKIFSQLTPEQYESAALCAPSASKQDNSAAQIQPAKQAMEAIMQMPLRLRHAFVLRFIYEYSNSEIARQLELTEVNVRKRIQLGRSLVRNKLEEKEAP